ncbi:MAG: hypothetical protein ACFNOJ_01365, partial [Prevotella nigrescens]
DAKEVVAHLGIPYMIVNIGNAYRALTEFCLYGCNTSISLKRYKQQQNTCIVSTIFYTFAKT